MDKTDSYNGFGGPLFTDFSAAAYAGGLKTKTINYIYGLGGRDVGLADIEKVYDHLSKISQSGEVDQVVNYLGVKE